MTVTRLVGDSRDVLATLPEKHFHCCVTSPPYFGLRRYSDNDPNEIGTEQVLDCMAWATGAERCNACYVCSILAVCDGVWRVLRDDGCFFLNIGDSYANKNLCMAPARLAFALQAAGWYVRSDIIWSKPNAMPGSQEDRCTSSHEYVWMLTKSQRYYFDNVAIIEPLSCPNARGIPFGGVKQVGANGNATYSGNSYNADDMAGRTKRDVWSIPTSPCSEAHFAVMPAALVEPCLLAATSQKGCCSACGVPWKRVVKREKHPSRDVEAQRAVNAASPGRVDGQVAGPKGMMDKVETIGWEPTCKCAGAAVQPCRCLDPFGGSGTVSLVAAEHGRDCTLIDLVPHNMEIIAVNRLKRVQPRLALEA